MADDDDPLGEATEIGGIFPFLSVLICTIGVMVFILVAGFVKESMSSQTRSDQVQAAFEEVVSMHATTIEQREDLTEQKNTIESAVSITEETRTKTSGLVAEMTVVHETIERAKGMQMVADREISELREKIAAAGVDREKLDSFREEKRLRDELGEIERKNAGAMEAVKKVSTVAGALAAQVAKLDAEHRERDRKVHDPVAAIKVQGEGSDAEPVVLDLRQGAVVVVRSQLAVAPVGAPVKGDAQEIFAFFDALAAEVANSPTRTYALLLVRPTSLETFVQARKAFQKWRAPYVHEPFDELWQPGAIAVRGALE